MKAAEILLHRPHRPAPKVVGGVAGKVGVERGDQRESAGQRGTTPEGAQGTFGRDVDEVGPERVERAADVAPDREGEPHRRVGGEAH